MHYHRNHCSRAIEYAQQRATPNADSWHTTLKGLLRPQQFLAHTSPGIFYVVGQILSRDSMNERRVILWIGQQSGNVRHDNQGIGLQRNGDGSGGTVSIDVQTLSLPAQRQRRDDGSITSIE